VTVIVIAMIMILMMSKFEITVRFFCKNDEKNDLETLYYFTTNLLEEMSYVPEFVALYEIIPYIRNFPLDDEGIRVAVKDYVEGGEKKDAIIKKYGKIEDWNTSGVTDMSDLFNYDSDYESDDECYDILDNSNLGDFNKDISKWDTSSVTNMNNMFWGNKGFNQPIGCWEVSSVTNMNGMFCCTKSFNQDISDWDTSNVTDMSHMFLMAESFNQDISKWNTSNVTNMKDMFWGAKSFNQSIVGWNTSKVTNMDSMFNDAKSFNLENAPWYHEYI